MRAAMSPHNFLTSSMNEGLRTARQNAQQDRENSKDKKINESN